MTITVSGVSRSAAFTGALGSLLDAKFPTRLFAKDATLWGEAAEPEAAVRLGWTDFAETAESVISEAEVLAAAFGAAGVDRFVLCGMGGSSLAPLVIAPSLTVLDSTHPATVRAALEGDLSRTAVVVSSKSGGTVETLSHLAAFEAAFIGAGIDPADRIVVVTDPASALAVSATESGKRVFLADPNVGGRFSALTAFGIVPSVLAGADMRGILAQAVAARTALTACVAGNPALILAAAISVGLPERFLLELRPDGSLPADLGLWIEQLVAESTGKDGRGVLPIALPLGDHQRETPASLSVSFGRDSTLHDAAAVQDTGAGPTAEPALQTAHAGLAVIAELGAQLLLWQVVTAALGFLLRVDPFNQPDVEAAKAATRESLGAPSAQPELSPAEVCERLRATVSNGGYVAIQAYVDSTDAALGAALEELRAALNADLGAPVSVGYGPRYLHSTGQFHKGGPSKAVFLQLVGATDRDVAIPGAEQSFGELMAAQAAGDARVLDGRGRPVVTVVTDAPLDFVRALLARY